VRGYEYQSIGPQFQDAKPIGGTSIDAATIEGGSVYPQLRCGVHRCRPGGRDEQTVHRHASRRRGRGVRYYTAIGPIRFDVAVPLTAARRRLFEIISISRFLMRRRF
jgi:translocation and assembly module TamA